MLFGTQIRWDLTLNCNLACRHCQVGDRLSHNGNHPPLRDVLRIIKALNPSKVSHVGLLGGEPLTYPYIYLVIEHLMEQGLPITISTNGLLIDNRLIDILRESFNWSVIVSLDGPDRATHEIIRGRGTFEPTVEKIRLITKSLGGRGVEIGLACTLTAVNIKRMKDMLLFARELNVDSLQLAPITDSGNARRHFNLLAVKDQDLIDATLDLLHTTALDDVERPQLILDFMNNPMKELLRKQLGIHFSPSVSGCTGATSSAAIDSHGRLWPCPTLSYTADNKILQYFGFDDNSLLTNDFAEIWQSAGFRKLRELNSRKLHISRAVPCRDCCYNSLCTPCPLPYIHGRSLDQSTCQNLFRALAETTSKSKDRSKSRLRLN
jgi:radical SAM protein with 4Fe4S-binding SPASM domain